MKSITYNLSPITFMFKRQNNPPYGVSCVQREERRFGWSNLLSSSFQGLLVFRFFPFALLGVNWLWVLFFVDGEVTDDFDHYSEDDFQDFFTFLFHNGNFLY